MLGRETIWSCVAALLLLTSAFAQGRYQGKPQNNRPSPPSYTQPRPQSRDSKPNRMPGVPQPPRNQPGHAGAWLRNYRNLSPEQQHRALESDPQFRRLPPQRQQQLQNRLHRFSNLPPQQQDRVLNRMETWEHLTPGQKQQARQIYQQFRQLPPNRRQEVNRAIRDMRGLSPEERDRLINSNRYRSDFSPMERNILSGASQLPLASGGLQGAPPE